MPKERPVLWLDEARPGDMAALAALEQEVAAFPWNETLFQEEWQAGALFRVLRTPTGQVAAYGVLRALAGEWHVMTLGVATNRQNQGVGRQLLTALLALARQRGGERAMLEVAVANSPAMALYRRLGFVEIGRRRGYYGKDQDALVMALDLVSSLREP